MISAPSRVRTRSWSTTRKSFRSRISPSSSPSRSQSTSCALTVAPWWCSWSPVTCVPLIRRLVSSPLTGTREAVGDVACGAAEIVGHGVGVRHPGTAPVGEAVDPLHGGAQPLEQQRIAVRPLLALGFRPAEVGPVHMPPAHHRQLVDDRLFRLVPFGRAPCHVLRPAAVISRSLIVRRVGHGGHVFG